MVITPQHQELQERHQKLVMKSMQFDMIVQKKDEQIKNLEGQVTPLKEMVEQLMGTVRQQQEENLQLQKMVKEKTGNCKNWNCCNTSTTSCNGWYTAEAPKNLQRYYQRSYHLA